MEFLKSTSGRLLTATFGSFCLSVAAEALAPPSVGSTLSSLLILVAVVLACLATGLAIEEYPGYALALVLMPMAFFIVYPAIFLAVSVWPGIGPYLGVLGCLALARAIAVHPATTSPGLQPGNQPVSLGRTQS
jgi:hypothetical protein